MHIVSFYSLKGWVPVFVDGASQRLSVMSIGFLLKSYESDAIIWRGPKKNAMVKQFITDVCWGELDFLIVDTPPGTSDEHISIVEAVQVGGRQSCATGLRAMFKSRVSHMTRKSCLRSKVVSCFDSYDIKIV